ncbi:hypothetical protein ACJZ2D_002344 [Fusarium nematophilum]
MAGPNPDSFERARKRFVASLKPELQQQFSTCSVQDVHATIRDIQSKQAKEGKQRHMQRLQSFVEAMEQFGKIIEVFLNAHEVVCFGPIKFLLTVRFLQIDTGDEVPPANFVPAIPGLLHYRDTFEKSSEVAKVLEDYYSDILNFHHEALAVFSRPKWKMLFNSTWKTFETNFGPILQSLGRRRELLESIKATAMLDGIQRLREDQKIIQDEQLKQAGIQERERHRLLVREIKVKLQSPDYQVDQEISTEDRNGVASGSWLFTAPAFQTWYDSERPDGRIMYIHGIPGAGITKATSSDGKWELTVRAGKTTLMSTVVEKLLNEKLSSDRQNSVSYFYFKYRQKNTHNSFLRAFLDQLINQNIHLSSVVSDELSNMEAVNLRATKKLEELVKEALETYRNSFLVLDGLDECSEEQTEATVEWLLSLINNGRQGLPLRILLSGQRDGVLDRLLEPYPSISLDASETPAHVEDIRQYCERFCDKIVKKFKLSQELKDDILSMVMRESNGMFLYARVVLDNLLSQTRLSRLKQELNPNTFPRRIEDAYERVVARILEESSPGKREDAISVLGLVIGAQRALLWREILAFFCIDPVQGEVHYDELIQETCKELCGSLIDVYPVKSDTTSSEGRLRIVHETARKYLIKREVVNTTLENIKWSRFCLQYLTSTPFTSGCTSQQIVPHAKEGYYSLQDYTVQTWYDHVQLWIQSQETLDSTLHGELLNYLEAFLETYGRRSFIYQSHSASDGRHGILDAFKNLPQDPRERNKCLTIELRTAMIRTHIEEVQGGNSEAACDFFHALHGRNSVLKCPKPWCDSFVSGFETADERKRHINRHERPFQCPEQGCFAAESGFESEPALQKHKTSWHLGHNDITFPKQKEELRSLLEAARLGDIQAVNSILASNWEISSEVAQMALANAARNGHLDICRRLLASRPDVNGDIRAWDKKGQSPLDAAAVRGHLDVVNLLLAHGNFEGTRYSSHDDPFLAACRQGQLETARALYEARGCPESFKHDAVWFSIQSGNLAILEFLLENGFGEYVHNDPGFMSRLNMGHLKSDFDEGVALLFCAAHPLIRSGIPIVAAIRGGSFKIARVFLSYPGLRLTERDLRYCQRVVEANGRQDLIDLSKKVKLLVPGDS